MLIKFVLFIAALLHFTFLGCDDSSRTAPLAYRRGNVPQAQPQSDAVPQSPKLREQIKVVSEFNQYVESIAAPGFNMSDADLEQLAALFANVRKTGASSKAITKKLEKMADLVVDGQPLLASLTKTALRDGASKNLKELFAVLLNHSLDADPAVIDKAIEEEDFNKLAILLESTLPKENNLAGIAQKVAKRFPAQTGAWLGEKLQRPIFKMVYEQETVEDNQRQLRNGLFDGLVKNNKSFTNAFTLIRDKAYEWGLGANLDNLDFSVTDKKGERKTATFAKLEEAAIEDYRQQIKNIATAARKKVAAQIQKIKMSPPMPTVIGMINCGNSCYLNSVLQPILHTPQINKLLNTDLDQLAFADKDLFGDKITDNNRLFLFLREVFQKNKMAALNTSVSPGPFVKKKSELMPLIEGSQEDASEFLTFFLDRLRTEFNVIEGKREFYEASLKLKSQPKYAINFQESAQYSVFDFWFTGYLRVDREKTDGERTQSFDPFQMLALPMPQNINATELVSLDKMIDDYSGLETLAESEGGGTKKISFYRLPKVLIIQAKRYKTQAGGAFRAEKLNNPIDFKSTLKINSDKDGQVEYELYATSNHGGGTGGGHYWSYVKNSVGNWFNANDSSIDPVDIDAVLKDNKSAYIFYYRRK